MQYQETKKPIKQIANELGVGVILEGSTRRSGNMIRITAQLIDAETEEHLWQKVMTAHIQIYLIFKAMLLRK